MSRTLSTETNAPPAAGPKAAFALPYRLVYAVATQDSILIYDTQQNTPIGIVSNLHCATFTDLAWYVSHGQRSMLEAVTNMCPGHLMAPLCW